MRLPPLLLGEAHLLKKKQEMLFVLFEEARIYAQHAADLYLGHASDIKLASFKAFQDGLPYAQFGDRILDFNLSGFARFPQHQP